MLYAFKGSPDGANPEYGDLVFEAGNIYGTTAYGGTSSVGTVYELMPSGSGYTESVIYNFSGLDGRHPFSGVIFDQAGSLYGTTYDGGPTGGGTVYQLTPSGSGWTETTLYTFFDDSNGDYPWGGLIFDSSENLYGANSDAGADGGTVYELSPPGTWTTLAVLYSFAGPFNARCGPRGTIVMDGAGNLYGTTYCDGANNVGNIWELSPSGGYKDLHDFTGGNDGGNPISNVVIDPSNGTLYGTASAGGTQGHGVVWEITFP